MEVVVTTGALRRNSTSTTPCCVHSNRSWLHVFYQLSVWYAWPSVQCSANGPTVPRRPYVDLSPTGDSVTQPPLVLRSAAPRSPSSMLYCSLDSVIGLNCPRPWSGVSGRWSPPSVCFGVYVSYDNSEDLRSDRQIRSAWVVTLKHRVMAAFTSRSD